MSYKFQRELTDEEMQTVKDRLNGSENLAELVVELFESVYDIILMETEGRRLQEMPVVENSLNPSDYAMEHEQVVEILNACAAKAKELGCTDDERVAITMQWVNTGPGYYNKERVNVQ